MRLIYNGLYLTPRYEYSGTGQYTRNLLRLLPEELPDAEHVVIVPEELPEAIPGIRVIIKPPSRSRLGRGLALDHWESHDFPKAAAKANANLIHAPYPTARLRTTIPVVMTAHDMITWQLPEYRRGIRRRLKTSHQLAGIRAADHLCTVSESAAADITTLTGRPASQITVTYDGLSQPDLADYDAAAVQRVCTTYGLERPYVVYVGGYDFRKNVRFLIAAFGESGLQESHNLVLIGAAGKPPTMVDDRLYHDRHVIDRLAEAAGCLAQIRKLPFVSEAEKFALLAGAATFAYPSLAEGFGIPTLEALAVGTPVVASDIPTNRELFADAVTMVSPSNTAELAAALTQVVTSPNPAKQQAGRRVAAEFTWQRVAAKTALAYRQVLGSVAPEAGKHL